MLNLSSLSTQSLASCVNYFVWNCLTCFSNTKIGSVTSFSILFNFQGPVRLSLAADDLIILPRKRFFVKYFFSEAFRSFRTCGSFFNVSILVLFALLLPLSEVILSGGPWRSSIIPHPQPSVNTFLHLFWVFFYISQKECFRAGFEPLRNGHGHFVSPLPRGEPLQFPGRCYII